MRRRVHQKPRWKALFHGLTVGGSAGPSHADTICHSEPAPASVMPDSLSRPDDNWRVCDRQRIVGLHHPIRDGPHLFGKSGLCDNKGVPDAARGHRCNRGLRGTATPRRWVRTPLICCLNWSKKSDETRPRGYRLVDSGRHCGGSRRKREADMDALVAGKVRKTFEEENARFRGLPGRQ